MRLGEMMTVDVEVIGSKASLKEAAAKNERRRGGTHPGL